MNRHYNIPDRNGYERRVNDSDGGLISSLREYINMRMDRFTLKCVENVSVLSSKVIVVLIFVMLGVVILQLLGFALSYMLGTLLGSNALGFLAVAGIFIIALLVIFCMRKRLFKDSIVRMFAKMFFSGKDSGNSETVENIEDVRKAEEDLNIAIAEKEDELTVEYEEFKQIINPMTYIEGFISKLTSAASAAGSVLKGFFTIWDVVKKGKDPSENKTDQE